MEKKIILSLFAGEMIVYVESPKGYTKTLPRTNKYSQEGIKCKINIQKSIAFLYTSSKHRTQNLKHNTF